MTKKSNSIAKKVLNVVRTIFTWIIIAITVFIMVFTLISVTVFDKNDRNLFGFRFYVVQSDSMAATDFNAGDVIISKSVDVNTLCEGDIITFISESSNNLGETVTHKIREVTVDEDGNRAFVTYGTTTDTNDDALATIILGQYVGRIPGLGAFFLFLKTTPGYITCILVPFLILILSQGISCIRLFRRYKKEQMDELESEREKLEQERAESQRMMAELMALKAQLAQKDQAPQPEDKPITAVEPEKAENSDTTTYENK